MTPQRELNRFPCRLNCSNSDITHKTIQMTVPSRFIFHIVRKLNIDYSAICSSFDYYFLFFFYYFFSIFVRKNSIEFSISFIFNLRSFWLLLWFESLEGHEWHNVHYNDGQKPMSSKLMIKNYLAIVSVPCRFSSFVQCWLQYLGNSKQLQNVSKPLWRNIVYGPSLIILLGKCKQWPYRASHLIRFAFTLKQNSLHLSLSRSLSLSL